MQARCVLSKEIPYQPPNVEMDAVSRGTSGLELRLGNCKATGYPEAAKPSYFQSCLLLLGRGILI